MADYNARPCHWMLAFLGFLIPVLMQGQPDLVGWDGIIRSMRYAHWVEELEAIEPGCLLTETEPQLDPQRFKVRTPWAERLTEQLEALPMAEHHADRALQRLLADGMLNFRLMCAAADRHQPQVAQAFEDNGLPAEWALLPLALTGWDNAYYGPGRRAGAWAMNFASAQVHGLEIRRGWDERHLPEIMTPAAVAHARSATDHFPGDPLLQVLAFVRGHHAARRWNPESLDAELLEWCHLLRVILQVERNFDRDDMHSLWLIRERQTASLRCAEGTGAVGFFSALVDDPVVTSALKAENPWFTTDSFRLAHPAAALRIPPSAVHALPADALPCGNRPSTLNTLEVILHEIAPGEVLGIIARDYGVRIEDIQRHNGLVGDLIRVGQLIEIPGGTRPRVRTAGPSPVEENATDDAPWVWHTVQEGESFWSIARQYDHAEMDDLMRMNDIPAESLRPGMKLRIPPP